MNTKNRDTKTHSSTNTGQTQKTNHTTRVTALVVHADHQAVAMTQAAHDLGVAVPGALSVVSYDDELAGAYDPPLTAVRPPRSAIGQAAMDLVAARLARSRRPPVRMRRAPQLILRESTGRPVRRSR